MDYNKEKKLFINEDIRAFNILLLDADGNKIGTFTRSMALAKAQQESKDLVQIGYNPQEKIATAKLMEVGKFLYLQKKGDNEKKKKQKPNIVKEIKFGYNIGENDFNLKIDKAKEFLSEGYLVKIIGTLKGREKMFKNKVVEKLENTAKQMENIGKSQGIKEEKNGFCMVLFPKSKQGSKS